jgi:thioesterase domain-containing protein
MPFPQLVQELVPNYDPSRFPIVQIMFNYLQPGASQRARKRRELELDVIPSDRDPISTRTDLCLTIADARGRLRANFKYDSALFAREDVEHFSRQYMHLLEAVLDHPDRPIAQLPILASAEREPLIDAGNSTAVTRDAAPGGPPPLEPQAPPQPDLSAATLAGRSLSYEAATAPAAALVDEPPPPAAVPRSTPHPTSARHRRWLAPLRAKGDRLPLYCIHGLGGHIAGFLPLAKRLREGRPVYGLQAQGLDGIAPAHQQLDEMAMCYLQEIREFQPQGPYLISGWSLGGLIAMDVARQLQEAGASVPLLVMYDTYLRVSNRDVPEMSHASLLLRIASRLHLPLGQLQSLAPQQQWDWIAERAAQSAGAGVEEIHNLAETCRAHLTAMARFQPKTYTGLVLLFRTAQSRQTLDPRWAEICPQLRVAQVPGNHYTMLEEPHVGVLAAQLDKELAAALGAEHPRG